MVDKFLLWEKMNFRKCWTQKSESVVSTRNQFCNNPMVKWNLLFGNFTISKQSTEKFPELVEFFYEFEIEFTWIVPFAALIGVVYRGPVRNWEASWRGERSGRVVYGAAVLSSSSVGSLSTPGLNRLSAAWVYSLRSHSLRRPWAGRQPSLTHSGTHGCVH